MAFSILVGCLVIWLEVLYNSIWLRRHPAKEGYPVPAVFPFLRIAGGAFSYQCAIGLTRGWSLFGYMLTLLAFYIVIFPILRKVLNEKQMRRLNWQREDSRSL